MTAPPPRPAPIPIVTARSIGRLSQEASADDLAGPIAEIAATPAEQAALFAALGDAMRHLEELDGETGDVMATARNANASLLQSAIAEHARRTGAVAPMEGGLEAQFDTKDLKGWAGTFAQMLKRRFTRRHPWIAPSDTPEEMPDRARIAVLGDWGTGTYGAPIAAQTVARDGDFTHLVHLGDVYYSGTREEVDARFLALWPEVPGAVSRACNGNHEMYCGGEGYFGGILPAFRQPSSCWALRNARWLLIGLDTAYDDHDVSDAQAEWVRRLVGGAGGRRVILFSHHQPFSRLEGQGPKLVAKLGDVLGAGRVDRWYWGHEHVCAVYDAHPAWKVKGRCVGHGGMPEPRRKLAGFRVDYALSHGLPDGAVWRELDATPTVPRSIVLDGPNKYMGTDRDRFTPHGYAVIELDGDRHTEQVRAPDGDVLWPKAP